MKIFKRILGWAIIFGLAFGIVSIFVSVVAVDKDIPFWSFRAFWIVIKPLIICAIGTLTVGAFLVLINWCFED